MKRSLLLLSFVFQLFTASAQEVLTLSDAMKLLLANNFDLQMAKQDVDLAKLNASRGNAGMLPQVGVNGSVGIASNDTKQEFSNGTLVDKNGASSKTAALGAGMTWTLFDGMKMFATFDRLQEEQGRSELVLRSQMENAIVQLIKTYSGIVRQKQLLLAADFALQQYEERMEISKTRWDVGAGSKMDYLQAKVDYNGQKAIRMQQSNQLENLKIELNELLGRAATVVYDVADSMQISYRPNLEDVMTDALKQNTSILIGSSQQRVQQLMMKELSSSRYPRLNWNAGYNFNNTANQAGFILQNRNLGWSTGLSASWTLYNGHQINHQIEGSRILLQQAQISLDQTKQRIDAGVMKAYLRFNSSMELLSQEEENSVLANEVMQVAMERYRLGGASNLELKDAQRSYEEAQSRLVNARYDAKLAETDLMQLNGMLVK